MRDLRFWRCRKAEDDDLDRELQVHLYDRLAELISCFVEFTKVQTLSRVSLFVTGALQSSISENFL